MKIRKPTVGPIVGYTSADQVRLWLRGDFQATSDGYRRCFGVARIKSNSDGKFGDPAYVKLTPHFDVTGVCAFTGLKPDTLYNYQIGWFFAETSFDNLDAAQVLDWNLATTGTFCTAANPGTAPRTFVVGSCRYLLRLWGGTIFDERGDKTFQSVLNQIVAGTNIHGLLMVGDQIYADDLNSVAPDTAIDDFLKRYRSVFGQPHLKSLMARVPTYMVLDDHEIEDNWPTKATNRDWLVLYPAAIHAYQIYQCSHSPLFELGSDGRIDGTLSKFWYTFTDGCCDCFVMDCRTERRWHKDPAKRQMIKTSQMEALLKWLSDGSGRVKLVVTSVPFFPDLEDENDDKWGGFIGEREQILEHILANKIRKVVFLSGDVHCSFSIELSSPKDPDFKIISVVSSSFFWPYPHMDEGGFDLQGPLKVSSGNADYIVQKASKVHSTDSFARLEVSPDRISILFFARKGEQLGEPVTRTF